MKQRQSPRTLVMTNGGGRDFTFSTQPGVDKGGSEVFHLKVQYGPRVVFQEQARSMDPLASDFSGQAVGKVLNNTPARGCRSIVVHSFTGGAHCCSTAILAISCGSRDYLFQLSLGHTDDVSILREIDDNGNFMLTLFDQRFVYYNADENHGLYHAESPVGIVRYATWNSQGWKIVSAGELKKNYTKLMNQELHTPLQASYHKVGKAIIVTYYALMSGIESSQAKRLLESQLPQDWKSIVNTVFTHIQSSITQFNVEGGGITAVPLHRTR